MKKKLVLMGGLPRSGKSTAAKSLQKCHNIPVVNRDAIRKAIHGQDFLLEYEDKVTETENLMVKALFEYGHECIIVDATHVSKKRRKRWTDLFGDTVDYYMIWMNTPVEICLRRHGADKIQEVIQKMDANKEALEAEEGFKEILPRNLGKVLYK